jgi:radical SAM superfamily enzyme YgiQ (UPF0313 family)
MKITLIKPTIGRKEHSLYVDEGRMEPLQLGVLAGLTPPDVEVVLYDDRMELIPYDIQTDLVAITVETYTARRSYEIANEYRKRGVPVIIGGMHPTLLPEEVANHADSIFVGDAELLWGSVVEDAKNGKLKPYYKSPPGIAQLGKTLPRRDIFQEKGYLPITLMQATRGCRFSCRFCAVSQYFDKSHFIRSIDEILREIEAQKRRHVFFVDDNIASNVGYLKELCRALIPMKIRWVSQASIDIARDLELMGLLVDSGCLGHVIGFESITEASLRETRKSPNIPRFNHFGDELKILRDFGLQTWAAFTLGYDNDTEGSISATLDFALKNKFTFAAFNILMPYPNTMFYRKLEEEGRLLYGGKWWLHPEYRFNNAAFTPATMTPEQLTLSCHNARVEFNSFSSILYRFSDVKTNLRSMVRAGVFLDYVPLFRKEVYKKHGMKFGLR